MQDTPTPDEVYAGGRRVRLPPAPSGRSFVRISSTVPSAIVPYHLARKRTIVRVQLSRPSLSTKEIADPSRLLVLPLKKLKQILIYVK